LAFMHFEKVVLRWEGFRTIVCIGSPGLLPKSDCHDGRGICHSESCGSGNL
jgi:hypothetical protein